MTEIWLTSMFILSTFWVGPFWFGMLFQPHHERTKKWVEGPLIIAGPLVAYFVVVIFSSNSFSEFSNVSSINDIVPALAALLGTPEGAVLAWIHFVIGDIVTTRWIWRRSVERNLNNRIAQLSIFFGVMLMPLGLLIYVLTTIDLSKSEE
tara:strand:- start:215 stop:664 length:450 start_codon:yes stop_codon:yes gene_type:complete